MMNQPHPTLRSSESGTGPTSGGPTPSTGPSTGISAAIGIHQERVFESTVFEMAKLASKFHFPQAAISYDTGNITHEHTSKIATLSLPTASRINDWREVRDLIKQQIPKDAPYRIVINAPENHRNTPALDKAKKNFTLAMAAVVALHIEAGRLTLPREIGDFVKHPFARTALSFESTLKEHAASIIVNEVLSGSTAKCGSRTRTQLILKGFNWNRGKTSEEKPEGFIGQLDVTSAYFNRMSKIIGYLQQLTANEGELKMPPLVIEVGKSRDPGFLGLKGCKLIVPRIFEVSGPCAKSSGKQDSPIDQFRTAFNGSTDMGLFLSYVDRLPGQSTISEDDAYVPFKDMDEVRRIAINAARHALTSSFLNVETA